ncbi:hypothetical protein ABFS82_03G054400 [Erythranthe guttata]|uniref:E3 ubiquitin-protein ligase RNF5-like n=1 Tax=Erythranthe guttata TaxID=4155 RepID=UPI00064D9BE7|nr:PREDICTED: E3 ubiquitin-protein ligase RNF5-like [Erythranthe guttata]|eukprot:XP_012845673.1 PREDICTED: E3 ubiquitin-protein ligase RNF5-like [Erythranthe guttata]
MASGLGESTNRQPPSPSCSSSNNNSDAANFECNICFELAQDPIVTLCGHLFCWPCLYKWLHIHSHSHSQGCPVCKALIEEEKLVPLYGRGKNSTDPRSKSFPGSDIPHRPTGQRPETAPPPDPNAHAFADQGGYGFMGGFGPFGGFAPAATARFGNFTLSTALGGLFPSFFNIQVHGFPDANMYGPGHGFQFGFPNAFHGAPAAGYGVPQHVNPQQQADSTLKMLMFVIAFSVLLTLIWS